MAMGGPWQHRWSMSGGLDHTHVVQPWGLPLTVSQGTSGSGERRWTGARAGTGQGAEVTAWRKHEGHWESS